MPYTYGAHSYGSNEGGYQGNSRDYIPGKRWPWWAPGRLEELMYGDGGRCEGSIVIRYPFDLINEGCA